MKRRVLLPFALAMCAALAFALPVMSDTLWDQSALNENQGYFNSISGSPPFGLTYYTVNDITVPASGWLVQTISTTHSAISATWGTGITQGRVMVYPKTSPIPPATDNPGTIAMTPMSAVFVPSGSHSPNNHWVITASGLNLALLPGEYWIGITPVAPAGQFGPETRYATTTYIGDPTPSWNAFKPAPLLWQVTVPGTDGNILITGTPGLPTATESGTWGAIKRLYR